MNSSRRKFVSELGLAGLAAPLVVGAEARSAPSDGVPDGPVTIKHPLDGEWHFRLDPKNEGEAQGWRLPSASREGWSTVTVPHTWQISEESAGYLGVAWYRRSFDVPEAWSGKAIRLEFEAVYHSATVWVNGQPVGNHLRKGYTSFTVDITAAVVSGRTNLVTVKVDNSFDQNMLPRGNSYDWTPDGGVIRPVSLLVTPKTFVERVSVEAQPVGANLVVAPGRPQGLPLQATLSIRAVLRNSGATVNQVEIGYEVVEEETGRTALRVEQAASATLQAGASEEVSLPKGVLPAPRLWHFDHPHLYRLTVTIAAGGAPLHSCSTTFGVRKIEVKDGGFYFNGERVWLMGVERMAGSNPLYGMAEPESWIVHDHDDLKELNCVFTRVHWQQDVRMLDYCDGHGILLQEEVPTWGSATFSDMGDQPSPEIMQNGLEQLREMIERDRNHPCIFSWGLCNEVNGQNPAAYQFAKRMYDEAKKLDPNRLRSYASNSLEKTPEKDVAGLMDFIEWNEYYETWYKGGVPEVKRNLEDIHRAFPDKPIVISEYGYCACTADRPENDLVRIRILQEHDDSYRQYPYVGGAIFFCYNDYRTHMGDKGIGVLKQRVHGVVDLYGARKTSFEALRQQASPIVALRVEREGNALNSNVETRRTLPCYALDGYTLRWVVYDRSGLPMEQHDTTLPRLEPGKSAWSKLDFRHQNPSSILVEVIRPTGFSAISTIWKA
ncbi:MAG: glycoside hydrolase family 2 TIM barrel-domain containing protein [Terriglobia bacterium]|jgi:beta-glucuronidase